MIAFADSRSQANLTLLSALEKIASMEAKLKVVKVSDATTRRARNIDQLIRYVRDSGNDGRSVEEAKRFLVKRYEYGIRIGTASDIIRDLVELRVFYLKGSRVHVRKTERNP